MAHSSKAKQPLRSETEQEYLFTCKGFVAARPRILNTRVRDHVTEIIALFDLKFNDCRVSQDIDHYRPDSIENVFRIMEEKCRNTFDRQDAVYTDDNGVMQLFDNKHYEPWWIVLESIDWKKIPKTLPPRTPTNPLTIEGKDLEVAYAT